MESSVGKGWTGGELIIICYYMLFEKGDEKNKGLINSLAEGIGRSYESILNKIEVIENIDVHNYHIYELESNIYLLMKGLGKKGCENMLQKAIENVIN